jgi:AraC family transcriptional regulator
MVLEPAPAFRIPETQMAVLTTFSAAREHGERPPPAALAAGLAQLLDCASLEMDGDGAAAKAPLGSIEEGGSGRLAPWQVRRLKMVIDERLGETLHIKDLAQVSRRSVAYFCRAFKKTFGQTPHAYVVGRRVERARALMLTTDMALSEIALSCGFTDQAHLCKLFRQSEGVSPAAWRRRQRETPSGRPPQALLRALDGRAMNLVA